MIQRIQSLYWTAAIILQIVFLYTDYAAFESVSGAYRLNALGLYETITGDAMFGTIPLLLLTIIVLLLLIAAIFLYKRRVLQIRLTIFALLLQLGQLVLMTYYFFAAAKHIEGVNSPNIPFLLPLLGAFFCYLAFRGVRRDINFLKRMDRVR